MALVAAVLCADICCGVEGHTCASERLTQHCGRCFHSFHCISRSSVIKASFICVQWSLIKPNYTIIKTPPGSGENKTPDTIWKDMKCAPPAVSLSFPSLAVPCASPTFKLVPNPPVDSCSVDYEFITVTQRILSLAPSLGEPSQNQSQCTATIK